MSIEHSNLNFHKNYYNNKNIISKRNNSQNTKSSNKKILKIENEKTNNIEEEYINLSYKNNKTKLIPNSNIHNKKTENEYNNNFRIKFKTEICHFYEINKFCKYGENCAFAHGESELKNRKLSFNYKTKPCKQFFELGYCSYGSRCQFSHKQKFKSISYLKLLTNFPFEKISDNILLKPRFDTFENLAHSNLKQVKECRIQLYQDLFNVKCFFEKRNNNNYLNFFNF